MTIGNHVRQRSLIVALAIIGVGCSTANNAPDAHIDYKSAGQARTQRLDIPPDLTQLQRDNRYEVPTLTNGVATASGYTQKQTTEATTPVAIAPQKVGGVRIERDGSQRWLVTGQTPEVLWPQLKSFWEEMGFVINVDSAQAGVMETDWAENRAKIPQDIIRSTLGKVFDGLYSTGERDKFRTRLERGANGTTEIFISHRGAEEVLTGASKETTAWTTRATDPGLEAEFLTRLMVRLGADKDQAKAQVAQTAPTAAAAVQPAAQARAHLQKDGATTAVIVDEEFDRAWRRVGLALDRVGFTVEDRNRAQGQYYVRYVDQERDAKETQGLFTRIFSSSNKEKITVRYRIAVQETGKASRVTVLNNDGQPDNSVTSGKILTLLNEQLQ
jgi:outer membrane protein assembly factor BamC